MDSAKICLAGVAVVSLAVIIKKWNSDFLPFLRLGATVLFAGAVLTLAGPIASSLKELSQSAGLAPYAALLLKALGIAILTQCCADICRDAGESGIGTGVEIAGKLEILLLSLPLMQEILTTAKELLALGA